MSVDLSTITASLSTITVNLGTPVDLGDGATIADNMTSLGGKTANAGTYDRTTDSQEAIRDQGDADWSATADLSTITASLATITANIGTPADLGSGADLANNLFDIDALNDSIIDGSALSIVTITNDVASLVAGTAPASDGITQAMLIEIASAMVNGKYALNTPGAGDITFYERDNVTPLTVVNVTASGRTRVSP